MAASASNRSDAGSDTASDTKKSRRRRNKKSSKPGADTGSDTAATASDVSDRAKRKTKTKRTPETPATAVPAAKPTATAEPTSRRKNDTRDSRRSSDRRPETAGEADAKSTQIHYKRDSNFDLSWYSNELRKLLVTSGGWLFDVVQPISELTGLWDIFVCAVIFVIAWVVLRIADPEVSFILGFLFDGTIPMQNKMNRHTKAVHETHLEQYWPIFFFATIVEFGCYLLIDSDFLTLIVCIKTLLMTTIWIGRREDGTFWTAGIGKNRTPSTTPDAAKSSRGRPDGGKATTDPAPTTKTATRTDSATPNKNAQSTIPGPAAGVTPSDRRRRHNQALKKAGYEPETARKAMVDWLADLTTDDPEEKLKEWCNDSPEGKNERMAKFARRAVSKNADKGEYAGSSEDDATTLAWENPTPRRGSRSEKRGGGEAYGDDDATTLSSENPIPRRASRSAEDDPNRTSTKAERERDNELYSHIPDYRGRKANEEADDRLVRDQALEEDWERRQQERSKRISKQIEEAAEDEDEVEDGDDASGNTDENRGGNAGKKQKDNAVTRGFKRMFGKGDKKDQIEPKKEQIEQVVEPASVSPVQPGKPIFPGPNGQKDDMILDFVRRDRAYRNLQNGHDEDWIDPDEIDAEDYTRAMPGTEPRTDEELARVQLKRLINREVQLTPDQRETALRKGEHWFGVLGNMPDTKWAMEQYLLNPDPPAPSPPSPRPISPGNSRRSSSRSPSSPLSSPVQYYSPQAASKEAQAAAKKLHKHPKVAKTAGEYAGRAADQGANQQIAAVVGREIANVCTSCLPESLPSMVLNEVFKDVMKRVELNASRCSTRVAAQAYMRSITQGHSKDVADVAFNATEASMNNGDDAITALQVGAQAALSHLNNPNFPVPPVSPRNRSPVQSKAETTRLLIMEEADRNGRPDEASRFAGAMGAWAAEEGYEEGVCRVIGDEVALAIDAYLVQKHSEREVGHNQREMNRLAEQIKSDVLLGLDWQDSDDPFRVGSHAVDQVVKRREREGRSGDTLALLAKVAYWKVHGDYQDGIAGGDSGITAEEAVARAVHAADEALAEMPRGAGKKKSGKKARFL